MYWFKITYQDKGKYKTVSENKKTAGKNPGSFSFKEVSYYIYFMIATGCTILVFWPERTTI